MRFGNTIYSNKIFLLVMLGAILIVSSLLTMTLNYNETKSILLKELVENSLPAETDRIAHKIKLELLPFLEASANFAHDLFIQKWILDGEHDKKFMTEYLGSIAQRIGAMTCFLASDRSMRYYNTNGNFLISRDDSDAAWYFAFKDSGQPYALNIANNVDMGDMPTMFINYRIDDKQGGFLGVVGVGLELAEIPRILDHFKARFDRSIYFVDARGDVISRSAGALFNGGNVHDLADMKAVFSNESAVFEYKHQDKSILVSTQHVPELDWWLFIEQDKALAMKMANRVMAISAGIDIGSIVLTMLLVFMTVSFFHKKLETMAATDRLTGISNRMTFEHMLESAFAHMSRSDAPFSVLLMDLDHFKLVNDTHGHLEGDNVLKRLVDVVKDGIRKSDEFCRWGGEEFVILAYDCNLEQGLRLAEKVRTAVKNAHVASLPGKKPLTVSIGVAEARKNEGTDACMDRADKALYRAKQDGRDCVRGN